MSVLLMIVSILSWFEAVKLNYPPTEEQLKILRIFEFINDKQMSLWGLRLVCWLSLMLALVYFFRKLEIWMCYPAYCLILILFLLASYGLTKKWFGIVLFLAIAVIGQYIFYKETPAIFHKFFNGLAEAKQEVTIRISNEDMLGERVFFPLLFRRVGYNKFFITYKYVWVEILKFLDVETIFFQEIHPMGQKSMILFFWPSLLLLGWGLIYAKKDTRVNVDGKLFIVSWLYYVFSIGQPFLRFMLVLVPISIVIASGIDSLIKLNKKHMRLAGIFLGICITGIGYGVFKNYDDLIIRRDFWFDNRPVAYQFLYENIKKVDKSRYDTAYVTTLIGDAKGYCWFYLGNECDKFKFDNFNLMETRGKTRALYAGIGGEFVGPDPKNIVAFDFDKSGIKILETQKTWDTIAYRYGDYLVIGIYE